MRDGPPGGPGAAAHVRAPCGSRWSGVGDANGPVLVSETGPGWGIPQVVVREGGVEPPHPFEYTDLNRARLPIPPLAHHSAAAA